MYTLVDASAYLDDGVLGEVAVVLLGVVRGAVLVNVGTNGSRRHDLVPPTQVEEDGAANVLQEDDALVPPEVPPQRLVDRDLLREAVEQRGTRRGQRAREKMPTYAARVACLGVPKP
jgi:hypothetical protein